MTDPSFRQNRVFISSTFRGMVAERDQLVKFLFTQLRRLWRITFRPCRVVRSWKSYVTQMKIITWGVGCFG